MLFAIDVLGCSCGNHAGSACKSKRFRMQALDDQRANHGWSARKPWMVGTETMDGRHGNHEWSASNHGCEDHHLQHETFELVTLKVHSTIFWRISRLLTECSQTLYNGDEDHQSLLVCQPFMVSVPTIHGFHADHPGFPCRPSMVPCRSSMVGTLIIHGLYSEPL